MYCVCVYECVCVRECVSVGARERAVVCLRASSLPNPVRNAPLYCKLAPFWLHHIFGHYLLNGTFSEKKVLGYFNFFYNFYLKHLLL